MDGSLTDNERGATPNRASKTRPRQAAPQHHHDQLAILHTKPTMHKPTSHMHNPYTNYLHATPVPTMRKFDRDNTQEAA